jgi:hypothetical protein
MHKASFRAAAVKHRHVTVPVLAGAAHADPAAILGHLGDDDDLWTAWHAPSFAEDVELDFAKTAGKGHLLQGT